MEQTYLLVLLELLALYHQAEQSAFRIFMAPQRPSRLTLYLVHPALTLGSRLRGLLPYLLLLLGAEAVERGMIGKAVAGVVLGIKIIYPSHPEVRTR